MKKDIEWLKSWFDDDKSYTGEYVKFKINHCKWGDGAEEEQKYYVLGKYDTPILVRDHRNRITETSNLSDIYPEANSEDFEFTEQEIKDFDPRYWAFAKPV